MNNELRQRIIAEAVKNGVTSNPITFDKKLINSYAGYARVTVDDVTYNVTGKSAKVHGAICTAGYFEIKGPRLASSLNKG